MKNNKIKVIAGLVCILIIAVSFHVAMNDMVYAQQAKNHTLRIATKHADSKTFDPHMAVQSQDRVIVGMIFNGLLRYPPGNLSTAIEPDLATSIPVPKIQKDGTQDWIINLKKGVMTHPYEGNQGYELTSEDVVYSLKRAADKSTSAYSADYVGMTFAAIDKYNVKISLAKPLSSYLFFPLISNRGGGLIVSKKVLEEKGDKWFRANPIGTGPFAFQSYTPMEKVVLSAHRKYFRGEPKLDNVEFYYMQNLNSRELALQKGEVDVVFGPNEPTWKKKIEKMIPGVVVGIPSWGETILVHFNMTIKPLNILNVRKAIAYALDRKEYQTLYGEDLAEIIYSPVPESVGGITKEDLVKENLLYEHDISKAKELLTKAGYPQGFSLNVFTSENDSIKPAYELMQASLKKIGITMNISVEDHPSWHDRIRKNLDPIVIYVCQRPNPDAILSQFYYSKSIVATGERPVTNFSHIGAIDANGDGKIDSIDKYIEAAKNEIDVKKQEKLWNQAQIELLQNMVAYPIIAINSPFAWKSTVDWGYKIIADADGLKATEKTRILK